MCGAPVPSTSRGVTCSFSCRAKLREQRKTQEWRKPRQYPPELVEQVRNLYVDQGMTVAEVQAVIGRGVKVQRVMENHNIPRRPTIKRNQYGEANSSWRGDSASYAAAHTRIYATRGPATAHECVDCHQPATEWAYEGGCPREQTDARGRIYSPDPSRYAPRCLGCHMAQDRDRLPSGQFVRKEGFGHGA
jgi:hypothetical protein